MQTRVIGHGPAGNTPIGAAGPEFIFLECVGRTPLGEIWTVRPPDGRTRLARFVGAVGGQEIPVVEATLERLQGLAHPVLFPVEVVMHDAGRFLLVSDPIERTLGDRFRECQAHGLPGIPRAELLTYLGTAAAALDHLAGQEGIQHLGLNPRSFVLSRGRVQLADFGVWQLLGIPAGLGLAELNARYAAGELFEGLVSATADQYSLALLFQELLTGFHPLRIPARQRAAVARGQVKPDLAMLPAGDRRIISQALHHDPAQRFPSCTALIDALEQATSRPDTLDHKARETRQVQPAAPTVQVLATAPGDPVFASAAGIANLVKTVAGPLRVREFQSVRYLLQPGSQLSHRCCATLLPGVATLKLAGFRQQWQAEVLRETESDFSFAIAASRSLWQRCLGKQVGVQVDLCLTRPRSAANGVTHVQVEIRPVGCNWDQGDQLLQELAPRVLHSLRTYLQAMPERRAGERLPWSAALRVCPMYPGQKFVEAIDATARDISTTGIGLSMPCQPPTSELSIHVTSASKGTPLVLLANVVRVEMCRNNRYEVGAVLLPAAT